MEQTAAGHGNPAVAKGRGAAQLHGSEESRHALGTHGFVQAYNARPGVDEAAQVVVVHGVTNQPADCLEPVLERAKENLGEAPAMRPPTNPDAVLQPPATGGPCARRSAPHALRAFSCPNSAFSHPDPASRRPRHTLGHPERPTDRFGT